MESLKIVLGIIAFLLMIIGLILSTGIMKDKKDIKNNENSYHNLRKRSSKVSLLYGSAAIMCLFVLMI